MTDAYNPAKTNRGVYGVFPDSAFVDTVSDHGADPAFAAKVRDTCGSLVKMLMEKNAAYGNAALDPVRVFSQATPEEQILVRIDDKLSRIQRGHDFADEDTVDDLIGYLILLKISRQ